MGSNPSRWKGSRNSVEMLSLAEANQFCKRATELMRAARLIEPTQTIRLPTESEWEYAARGGGTDYGSGDRPEAHCGTTPVGACPPNGYGLFDMIGNVWEWTTDWYKDRRQPDAHGQGNDAIARKVIKGGPDLASPHDGRRYRPAARMAQPVDSGACHLGFRCVARRP